MGWFGILPVGSQQLFKTISKQDVTTESPPGFGRQPLGGLGGRASACQPQDLRVLLELGETGPSGYVAFLHIYPP